MHDSRRMPSTSPDDNINMDVLSARMWVGVEYEWALFNLEIVTRLKQILSIVGGLFVFQFSASPSYITELYII